MLVGTAGIVLGGPLAYLASGSSSATRRVEGLRRALSGSWIGGTATMDAIHESVGLDDLGPIIVVDTVVGYCWMGILLFLSAYRRASTAGRAADTAPSTGQCDLAQID